MSDSRSVSPSPLPLRRSRLLDGVPGLVHGFTTRSGPGSAVSDRDIGFDLGAGAPLERWAAVAGALGLPDAPTALVSQVHGATVLKASALQARAGGLVGEADALWTDRADLLVAVRTADCVPVLVVDTDDRGRALRVAAVHAGWRGLAAGTIGAALAALDRAARERAGPAVVARLAAVGPCIGQDAYEVGPEVVDGIAAAGVPRTLFARRGQGDRWFADLKAVAAWQLARGGTVQVDVLPDCTWSDPSLHSYRRDGARSGRLAGVIGRTAPGGTS